MKTRIIAAALACLVPFTATAHNMKCGVADAITDQLTKEYGESLLTIMLDQRETPLGFWGNSETGTWTLTVNTPDGAVCILSHGIGYTTDVETPPADIEG